MGSKALFTAIVAGFMAIALTACGGGTVAVTGGGTNLSIAPTIAPTITTQPTPQNVSAGQTASFTVVASGTGPLAYQWQKNENTIDGATLSTYTTPATSSADSGASFSVKVSNSAGTATSNKAALTVSAAPGVPGAPAIGTQPANQSVVAGQTATFTVTASGTRPFTYQWQKNGTNISGATTSTYTTPATTMNDDGAQFWVVVGNKDYTVSSSKATLTVTIAAVA
ncbi:MAG: glycoside hydrolase family 2, partial [Rhodoferax sp.]|nr:glycoside hydrolase family 2 [Rhodoferax sp.]